MDDALAQLEHLLATESRPFAMATLVSATGRTPRRAGARMWVGADGGILGTITIGGCVDARVVESAERVLASGSAELHTLSLDDDQAWEIGLTCGGTVEVLVERVEPGNAADAAANAYRRALIVRAAGQTALVATRLDAVPLRLVASDGSRHGTLGSTALDDLVAADGWELARGGGRAAVCELGEPAARVYLELLAPPETAVIYGAGEVARSLVPILRELSIRVVLVDGRSRYATPERFPSADEIHIGMPSEIAERVHVTPQTYVVLVAHDYKYELPVLRVALRGNAGYIGMLGSRKRGAAIKQLLADDGLSEAELARLRTPIGLDIGARTPAEIALAVAAEIVAVREGRTWSAAR
jgi:xanthine dehydrogenase accessory factor